MVNPEISNKKDLTPDPSSKGLKRINKYTPAVTNVDEWTKADTGVGAAIAAGSQAENGIWALFVIAAKTTNTPTNVISGVVFMASK
jgi:hypothetical protein